MAWTALARNLCSVNLFSIMTGSKACNIAVNVWCEVSALSKQDIILWEMMMPGRKWEDDFDYVWIICFKSIVCGPRLFGGHFKRIMWERLERGRITLNMTKSELSISSLSSVDRLYSEVTLIE